MNTVNRAVCESIKFENILLERLYQAPLDVSINHVKHN